MIPTAIKAALQAWAAAICGLDVGDVFWLEEPMPAQPNPCALLETFGLVDVGVDQTIYETNPDAYSDPDDPSTYLGNGDDLQAFNLGHRRFTLQLAVESFDQTATYCAETLASEAKRRSRWRENLDLLSAAGLALVRIAGSAKADYDADGRRISRRVLDFVIGASIDERSMAVDDPTLALQQPVPSIQQVRITSELQDVPTPPQIDDEVFP